MDKVELRKSPLASPLVSIVPVRVPNQAAHAWRRYNRSSPPSSGGAGDLPRLLRGDPELEPEHLGAERNRLAGEQGRFTGGPQHIDHVDWDIDLRERATYALAEELATARIHGRNPLALRL